MVYPLQGMLFGNKVEGARDSTRFLAKTQDSRRFQRIARVTITKQ